MAKNEIAQFLFELMNVCWCILEKTQNSRPNGRVLFLVLNVRHLSRIKNGLKQYVIRQLHVDLIVRSRFLVQKVVQSRFAYMQAV